MPRRWFVAGAVGAALVLAGLAGIGLQAWLRPGPPIPSQQAAAVALASERGNRYNGRPAVGWRVTDVTWDPSGDVAFRTPSGVQRPPPCSSLSLLCVHRELWHVELQTPVQADGSWEFADVYVDAHTGTVVATGSTGFAAGTASPPPAPVTPAG